MWIIQASDIPAYLITVRRSFQPLRTVAASIINWAHRKLRSSCFRRAEVWFPSSSGFSFWAINSYLFGWSFQCSTAGRLNCPVDAFHFFWGKLSCICSLPSEGSLSNQAKTAHLRADAVEFFVLFYLNYKQEDCQCDMWWYGFMFSQDSPQSDRSKPCSCAGDRLSSTAR